MSVFSTILNFFGTKSDRDMKELAPSVNEVLSHTQTFSNFSHDQLREKTLDFQSQIKLVISNFDKKIENLKKQN